MKFIDWFAGIGGFRRGMELAGHECVGFCEFDKYAVISYTAMHLCTQEQLDYLATLPLKERQKEILKEEYRNGEWYANDVRSVDARSIPDSDCWCFGFPCQDISVAGKQLGFTGNRSSLFFRVMYLVGQLEEEKRPAYLFIENVKNLLSVNGGWDFARLLTEMDRGGYDAEWSVLNSKYFGVPQNRERCFIVGHLRGRSTAEVFPVEGTNGENYLHRMTSIIGHRDGYRRNTQDFDPDGVTETPDTGAGGGRGHHTIEVVGVTRESKVVKDPTKVAIPVLTPDRGTKRQNGRRFKEDGEEAFTLTSQDRHGVAVEVSVEPVQTVDEAHNLNCTDQRKVFGAHQTRTMVGYNATSKQGGRDEYCTDFDGKGLQRTGQSDDDNSGDMFAIDKGITPKEREIANCIRAREDSGLSKYNQQGTLICHKIT